MYWTIQIPWPKNFLISSPNGKFTWNRKIKSNWARIRRINDCQRQKNPFLMTFYRISKCDLYPGFHPCLYQTIFWIIWKVDNCNLPWIRNHISWTMSTIYKPEIVIRLTVMRKRRSFLISGICQNFIHIWLDPLFPVPEILLEFVFHYDWM